MSAGGAVIEPTVSIQGKHHQQHKYTHPDNADDYLIGLSDSGYTNDHLALLWLNYLHAITVLAQKGSYQLFLLDRHVSNTTADFLAFCERQRIMCFVMPPHATQPLQPLDVVLHQPYKHYHAEAFKEATRASYTDLNKHEFLAALTSIWLQLFKKLPIWSAFEKTDIFPFCPMVVLDKICEYEQDEWNITSEEYFCLPSTSMPKAITATTTVDLLTPMTVRSLKHLADHLLEAPFSLCVRCRRVTFMKGSLLQAFMDILLIGNLEMTRTAESTHAARKPKAWNYGGQGGAVYTSDGHAIAKTQ